ncbi:MAG: TadE family protein [Actinomycetota bacterium]
MTGVRSPSFPQGRSDPPGRRPRLADGRGSASIEFAIIMSALLVGFFGLMIVAGRILQQENQVRSAAEAAARAASLEPTLAEAEAAAVTVAQENLTDAGVTCEDQAITIGAPTDFIPGGRVTVRVECTARSLGTLAGLPSNRFYHDATEAIDLYRGDP